jgi:TPR repeat protein
MARRRPDDGLHAQLLFRLGDAHARGENGPKDLATAVPLFRQAAGLGNAHAQCSLGYCFATGKGVAQDWAEAVRHYRLAVAQGDA